MRLVGLWGRAFGARPWHTSRPEPDLVHVLTELVAERETVIAVREAMLSVTRAAIDLDRLLGVAYTEAHKGEICAMRSAAPGACWKGRCWCYQVRAARAALGGALDLSAVCTTADPPGSAP